MIRTSSTATPSKGQALPVNKSGFTLIEAIVMTVLLALLTGLVLVNISGLAFGSRFSTETTELVSMLRQAYSSSPQTPSRTR